MTYEKRIPLLKDHHTHPSLYTALGSSLDLRTVRDKARAIELIKVHKDPVVVVFGWNNSLYSFEKKELASFGPLFICNVSLHSFIMNTPAKEMFAGSYPDIVTHIENPDWVEKHLPEIFKFIVNIKPGNRDQVVAFQDYLNRQGIWYAEEMLLSNRAAIDSQRELGYSDRTRFWADLELFQSLDSQTQKQVHGIKVFTDGALGPRTAAVQAPYPNGDRGILIYSEDELSDLLGAVTDLGKPVAIHAIGDAANGQVVTALHNVNRSRGALPPCVRMEHCQFISAATARQAREIGVVLSMQPNFSYDSVQYRDRLSRAYCERNNPFRMLIDEAGFTPGEDLLFGSDGMPHGIKYALEMSLFPPVSNQRLTLDEFVAGYCMDTLDNGHIDIRVDESRRTVLSRVIIRK